MKKLVLSFLIILIIAPCVNASLFKKDPKPELYLTSFDPRNSKESIQTTGDIQVFKTNERIYFTVLTKKGFKSDFIKYQIIKQDDNAHIGGYSRVSNKIVRVQNNNYYIDYFTISQGGKYFLQIFDIENLHQWIAMGAFAVIDE